MQPNQKQRAAKHKMQTCCLSIIQDIGFSNLKYSYLQVNIIYPYIVYVSPSLPMLTAIVRRQLSIQLRIAIDFAFHLETIAA